MSQKFFSNKAVEGGWDPEGYRQWLMTQFPVTFEKEALDNDYLALEEIEKIAKEKVFYTFENKIAHQADVIRKAQEMLPPHMPKMEPLNILREVIRNVLIRNIDKHWQEHLLNIDHLRTEVHLRVVGQKDPLLEFKHEAFALFDSFSLKLKLEIAHALFKFEMVVPQRPPQTISQDLVKKLQPYKTDLSLLPEIEEIVNVEEDNSPSL